MPTDTNGSGSRIQTIQRCRNKYSARRIGRCCTRRHKSLKNMSHRLPQTKATRNIHIVHDRPVQPLWQEQRFGETHTPLLQLKEHSGVSHVGPDQPEEQRHTLETS
jgi:hypothetical protein